MSGPLLRRKSMGCNTHLQVASYDKYPGPFLTASDYTRQRQSKYMLNIHLFQKCFKQPGSQSICAGIGNQQQTVNQVTAGGISEIKPREQKIVNLKW